jgi:mannose-6-phosphate isomerase-like protein (cupin superfamily)
MPEPIQEYASTTAELQFFDVGAALQNGDGMHSRVDMAKSPNSYIAVFDVGPRAGETRVHSHPDSDQILFILKGECTVEGLSGRYVLESDEGVLIPAGVNYGFTNMTQDQLVFLSMRTEGSGGRRIAYVPSVPSPVSISIPVERIGARGIGSQLYAYALDGHTIGISPLLLDDWNRACVLRMECAYEQRGDHVVTALPERMADWYRLESLTASDYALVSDPDNTRVQIDLTPLIVRASRG